MKQVKSKKTTLSNRLSVAISTIVALVFCLAAIVNYRVVSQKAYQQLNTKTDEYLATLSHSLELPLWVLDNNLIQAIALSYLQNDLIVSIRITETDGQTEIFSRKKGSSGNLIQRTAPIIYQGKPLGKIYLSLSGRSLQQQLNDLLNFSLATTILTITALFFFTGLVLRYLLRQPLLALQNGISRLAAGNYSEELSVDVAELQPIAMAFTQMAHQIEEREQESQQIAEASWEAILILEQERLLHANEQFLEIFNFHIEQLTGTSTLPRIIAPNYHDEVKSKIASNDLAPFETVGMTADGQEFPIEIRSRLLDQKGKTLQMIAIRDLRERKHLEDLMIQSEKMISVGGLAAGMAHEINNPLAGILQNAQVINNRLKPDMNKNKQVAEKTGIDLTRLNAYMEERGIHNMLENIRSSGQRAARIVDNILSFSRKSESLLLPTDILALIDESIHLAESDYDLKKRFDFRKIEIIKETDPELPLVPCDPSQIQQVLLNLLKNGAHAMASANTKAPRFIIRSAKDNHWIRLEIEDNGPGMPEETRRRIFEPFFTTKKVGEGTGLGLSVSYFIITQTHHGELTVRSGPHGTLFTIHLPLTQKES